MEKVGSGSADAHRKVHEGLLAKKRLLDSELVLHLAVELLAFERAEGYRSIGYDSFAEYCRKELRLGPSTARYYLQVARFIKQFGKSVPWEDWVALGPTKIRVLAALEPEAKELRALMRQYGTPEISSRQMERELQPQRASRRSGAARPRQSPRKLRSRVKPI
jgi:hypothetical protein